jgi:hypothetical protein
MKYYLLIGAGFSYNWGGWLSSEAFEFLLGDPAVVTNRELRRLLWKHQQRGGFEAALDELQRHPDRHSKENEVLLRAAIARMFAAMNLAFTSGGLEFGRGQLNEQPVRDFLVRFDAIFSLNQDLLLENRYRGTAEGLIDSANPKTQRSWQLPGMMLVEDSAATPRYPLETGLWVPSGQHDLASDGQPIVKLHGSSNWRTAEGSEVMILGGGKAEAIARFPILRWYADLFVQCIARSGAKLMIIGYGFRDDNINNALERGLDRGLRVFIVDPKGAFAADSLNEVPKEGIGYAPTTIQQKLVDALVGASRRPFASTFSMDSVERQKVDRFFKD